MTRATAVVLLVVLALSAGCRRAPVAPPPAAVAPPAVRVTDLPRVGRFTGVLPCAGCAGVQTELTLASDWEGRYRYRLVETRLDGGETLESEGTWTVLRGTPDEPDSVVYQLDPDRPGQRRHFLVLDERRISLLDESLSPIGEPLSRADL